MGLDLFPLANSSKQALFFKLRFIILPVYFHNTASARCQNPQTLEISTRFPVVQPHIYLMHSNQDPNSPDKLCNIQSSFCTQQLSRHGCDPSLEQKRTEFQHRMVNPCQIKPSLAPTNSRIRRANQDRKMLLSPRTVLQGTHPGRQLQACRAQLPCLLTKLNLKYFLWMFIKP